MTPEEHRARIEKALDAAIRSFGTEKLLPETRKDLLD